MNARTWRRYKALIRYALVYTDFLKDRRISFITLTMQHTHAQSYRDKQFRRALVWFLKRLRKKYNAGFVYVYEPHADGYIHAHVIAWNMPYVSKLKLVEMWEHALRKYFPNLYKSPSVDIQLILAWDIEKGEWINGKGEKVESALKYVSKYIGKNIKEKTKKRINIVDDMRLKDIYRLFSLNMFGYVFESISVLMPSWSAFGLMRVKNHSRYSAFELRGIRERINVYMKEIEKLAQSYKSEPQKIMRKVVEAADEVYTLWVSRRRKRKKQRKQPNGVLAGLVYRRYPSPARALRSHRRLRLLLPKLLYSSDILYLSKVLLGVLEKVDASVDFVEVLILFVVSLALKRVYISGMWVQMSKYEYVRGEYKGAKEEHILRRYLSVYADARGLYWQSGVMVFVMDMPKYRDYVTLLQNSYIPEWFLHVYEGERRKRIREFWECVDGVDVETPPALPLWSLFAAAHFLPQIAKINKKRVASKVQKVV